MFCLPAAGTLYPIIWKVKLSEVPGKAQAPFLNSMRPVKSMWVSFFIHSKPWHIFAAYWACKGQKIILFRSTPADVQLVPVSGKWSFFTPLFTCQEETEEKKKSWQNMGHPGPERESHALAQPVNITQPHREIIMFWELSRLCIMIHWGGLLPCMNNTMMQW